jgi:hypothetical protein
LTKLASGKSKVERGNSHSLERKLAESESQLMEAKKTINIVKQEKKKIEKEVERKEIEILECRRLLCYMNNRNNKGEKM